MSEWKYKVDCMKLATVNNGWKVRLNILGLKFMPATQGDETIYFFEYKATIQLSNKLKLEIHNGLQSLVD